MEKTIIYLKKKKKQVHSAGRMTLLPVLFLPVATTPVPNVLGKCWKVAHWSAKKLLRKVHPKFLDILYIKRS